MAKILLVVSIIITLVTAGLGFMTKNKVDALQGNLSRTKTTLATTENNLKKTKKDLEKTTEDLGVATKTIEERNTEIAGLKTNLDTEKKRADEAVAQVAQKETQLAELNAKIAQMTSSPTGASPEEVAQKLAALEQERNTLQTQLAEAKTVAESANARVRALEDEATPLRAEVKRYQDNVAKVGVTGNVVAVNPGWNFVVVNVGDRQGSMVGAPLIVMRGGQMIARAKVTSVEPGTSIADVVPGSLARGTAVQPGDRVVFAQRPEKPGTPGGNQPAQPQQQAQGAPGQAAPGQPSAAVQ